MQIIIVTEIKLEVQLLVMACIKFNIHALQNYKVAGYSCNEKRLLKVVQHHLSMPQILPLKLQCGSSDGWIQLNALSVYICRLH